MLRLKSTAWEERKERISWVTMSAMLPSLKIEYPFLADVNAQSLQSAIRNLNNAYDRFFKGLGKYPRFKKKSHAQSYQCPQGVSFDAVQGFLNVPKIKRIRAIFHRPIEGKIKTCTVSKTASGKYYVSCVVEQEGDEPELVPISNNPDQALGIDVGLTHLAIMSDGTKVDNPRHLKRNLKQLKREQRRLSRKKLGSNQRNKQRIKIARIHEKVANQRRDTLHKLTHTLVSKNHATTYCVESLNVKGMIKNRRLSRAISDVGWGMFYEMLAYKARRAGKNVIKIGRFMPSSKTCNTCGSIQESMPLNIRHWTCEGCNTTHDRDINAARNIRDMGIFMVRQEVPKPNAQGVCSIE